MKRKIFSILFALVLVCSFSLVTAVPAGAVAPGAPTIDGVLDEGEWDDYYLGTSVTAWEGGMSVDVYGFADDTYLYAAYVADMAQPGWSVGADMCISANLDYLTPTTAEWPDPGYTHISVYGDGFAQTDGSDWAFPDWGNTDPSEFTNRGIEYYVGEPCYGSLYPNTAEIKIPLSLLTYAGDNHFIGLSGQYWQYDFAEPLLVMLPPSPTTVWVDDGWVGFDIGDPADGHTFGYDAFATIQEGIVAVAPNGTVNVAAGTYYEAVLIDKQLTLLGAQYDVDPTVEGARLDGSAESIIDAGGLSAVVTITADSVSLNGFTIKNGGGLAPSHLRGGVYLSGTLVFGCTISNNKIVENLRDGIDSCSSGSGVNVFENNVISNNGYGGIFLGRNEGGDIFRNNVISYNEDKGHTGQIGIQSGDNIVEGNTINGDSFIGIYIIGSSVDIREDNILRGNIINRGESGPGFPCCAVGITYAENTLVEDNTIHNNVVGVSVGGSADTTFLRGNDIQGNDEYGIKVGFPGHDTKDTTIEQNDILNNDVGIWIRSDIAASTTHINLNNIVGNTSQGMLNDFTLVDATKNWWGDAVTTTIAIESLILGPVDYSPWLVTSPITGTAPDIGASVHPWTWYTNDSIQDAIDVASDGDTINVAAGEYDAFAVEGRSDLSIIGEDATVDDVSELDGGDWVMALIMESTDIDIEGIDFDGTGVSPQDAEMLSGIAYINSTGSITDLTVSDITGAPHAMGICVVGETTTTVVDLSVVNVDSSKVGIFIWNAEANLDDCTITGMSPVGGIGIMAIDGALVSVKNSEISDCWVEEPEPEMAGLGMMIGIPEEEDLSTVDMTGCTISNNNLGIYIDEDGELVAHFNNIAGNDVFGVHSESLVDATNNWWGDASGPHATTNLEGQGNEVSDNVAFSPWLGATFDTTPMTFVELVTSTDPAPVTLLDEDDNPIAIVDISGGDAVSGTIAAYSEPEDPTLGLFVGTGATGVVFLDVKVTGYTEGWAHITVPYTDADVAGVEEDTLGLYYWDDATSVWLIADNNVVDPFNNNVSGDIPIDALTGTPIGLGGYEALVAIDSILNLNYPPGGIVYLTIDTNTAFLGAATVDLIFDPRVVEVTDASGSDFDSLTVNLNYGVIGKDTQIARFVAYQEDAAGVNATGGALVAEVKLIAVGNTMDVSPLTLHLETLTDNKGDWIPFTLGDNDSIAIVGGIGDADHSGVVDVFDCVYIARAIAGWDTYSIDTPTMDVSGDDIVDAWDCTYLARHIAFGSAEYPLPVPPVPGG